MLCLFSVNYRFNQHLNLITTQKYTDLKTTFYSLDHRFCAFFMTTVALKFDKPNVQDRNDLYLALLETLSVFLNRNQ